MSKKKKAIIEKIKKLNSSLFESTNYSIHSQQQCLNIYAVSSGEKAFRVFKSIMYNNLDKILLGEFSEEQIISMINNDEFDYTEQEEEIFYLIKDRWNSNTKEWLSTGAFQDLLHQMEIEMKMETEDYDIGLQVLSVAQFHKKGFLFQDDLPF